MKEGNMNNLRRIQHIRHRYEKPHLTKPTGKKNNGK